MEKQFVAITGGIGSGKTLASEFARELGYAVFSCDALYKEVILSSEYIAKVQALFPEAVQNGRVDRKKLSDIVFNDAVKLQQLNNISHPLIMELLLQRMDMANGRIIFAEVPLLLEGGFEKLFHRVIYIYRSDTARVNAVMARDGCTLDEVKKRMNCQFNPFSESGESRLKNCNALLIENDGSPEDLKNKIKSLIDEL